MYNDYVINFGGNLERGLESECPKWYTVEPPNKGHFGSMVFVLYWEAVLWWEVRITTESTRVMSIGAIASVLYTEVVLWWEGPL